jgi:hypothetical protein
MQINWLTRFWWTWIGTVGLVVGCLLLMQQPVRAQTTITFFDEPLAPYGYWVEDPYYGRVWRPREPGVDWRPYTFGRWVYTSDYGWIWVSEETWGWIVYHYGRWVWSSRYGWVWVAGDDWSPAWVEWCYGGGYVGWAPMPPDPYWQGDYYYGSYDCASPGFYSRAVFVSETYFASPRVSAYIVAPSQNALAARATVNVTNYGRVHAGILNRSIDVKKLQAATGQRIKPIRVIQSPSPVAPSVVPGAMQTLKIYRPPVTAVNRSMFKSVPPPLTLDRETPNAAFPGRAPDIGTLPSLDRPSTGDSSTPYPGGIGSPSIGGPSIGGGLGGLRGRLGR